MTSHELTMSVGLAYGASLKPAGILCRKFRRPDSPRSRVPLHLLAL